VDPVPDPLLLRKCDSAGNRTRDVWVSSQKLARGLRATEFVCFVSIIVIQTMLYLSNIYISSLSIWKQKILCEKYLMRS
jgi:hypothetical protein